MKSIATASILLVAMVGRLAFSSPAVPALPPQPDLQKLYGDALEAIFGMGIRLQVILQDPKSQHAKNFIMSPLSATSVIAQLMLGADGDFRDQLYYLLSLMEKKEATGPSAETSRQQMPYARLHRQLGSLLGVLKTSEGKNGSFVLKEVSSFFVDKGVALNKTFEKRLRAFYRTEVRRVDYAGDGVGAQKLINAWGSEHTKGLIPAFLREPLPEDTMAMLANAIYFYGEWEYPFSAELNRVEGFHVAPDKTVNATLMTEFFDGVPYAERPDYTMVCLPYTNRTLSMYILLPSQKNPNAYNVRSFVETLKTNDIHDAIASAGKRAVMVRFPKMTLSSSVDLLEPLRKFKVYRKQTKDGVALESRTNDIVETLENKVNTFASFNATKYEDIMLNAAATNAPLKVSGIWQQTTISVTEKGTEAAAITYTEIDRIGGHKRFLVNRPFVFFIRHEPTSAILFWGAVSNPADPSA